MSDRTAVALGSSMPTPSAEIGRFAKPGLVRRYLPSGRAWRSAGRTAWSRGEVTGGGRSMGRKCIVWVTSLLPVVLLVGCSGGPDHDAAVSRSTRSDTTAHAGGAEIEKAYRAYWTVHLTATADPEGEHPEIEDHLTGSELERLTQALDDLAARQQRLTGGFGHRIEVGEVSALAATVLDCLRPRVHLVGSPAPDVPHGRDWGVGTRATLRFEDDRWKVAELTDDPTACERRPDLSQRADE